LNRRAVGSSPSGGANSLLRAPRSGVEQDRPALYPHLSRRSAVVSDRLEHHGHARPDHPSAHGVVLGHRHPFAWPSWSAVRAEPARGHRIAAVCASRRGSTADAARSPAWLPGLGGADGARLGVCGRCAGWLSRWSRWPWPWRRVTRRPRRRFWTCRRIAAGWGCVRRAARPRSRTRWSSGSRRWNWMCRSARTGRPWSRTTAGPTRWSAATPCRRSPVTPSFPTWASWSGT
jgi:hypothetical protein